MLQSILISDNYRDLVIFFYPKWETVWKYVELEAKLQRFILGQSICPLHCHLATHAGNSKVKSY